MTKNGFFLFHKDWYEAIKELPDKERLDVCDAICAKAFGEEIKELSPSAQLAVKFIFPIIERNARQRSEKSNNK